MLALNPAVVLRLTNWGTTCVGVYYVLVCLNYRWNARYNRATLIAFETAWAI
jgi:hypothetical protein